MTYMEFSSWSWPISGGMGPLIALCERSLMITVETQRARLEYKLDGSQMLTISCLMPHYQMFSIVAVG